MKRAGYCAFALMLAVPPHDARAQNATALPDPATIDVPNIVARPDAETVDNGHKYFFFYRADTSFGEAFLDLHFCTQFTHRTETTRLPAFVPWGEQDVRPEITFSSTNYGLVGDVIGLLIAGPLDRGEYLVKMRRCMEPRGYVRYPMSRAAWEAVHPGQERQSLLMQAKLATGVKPNYAEARQ